MPDVRFNLVVDGKTSQATLRLTEEQVRRLGLTAEQTGTQMGAAFARGAGVAETSMQSAVQAVQQLQAGTLQSIRQVDEAIRHLEAARAEATTEAGRGLFSGMIQQAQDVRQGFVQVSDAAGGMAAAQGKARMASQTLNYTLNDAQQFAFGFDQGVRAISNNLPMLIGQLGDVARTSGGAKKAAAALIGAFTGPAGILSLVSLGVVAFGAFSAAQERSEAATKKQTEALKKQEEQVRDNIVALREMSGAALGAQLNSITAQVAAKQQELSELTRQQLDLLGRNDAETIMRFDPASQALASVSVAEERRRITEGIAAAEKEVLQLQYQQREAQGLVEADLDAELAALKQQEEQIIRNNELSEEERQTGLRGIREQIAAKEQERERRAGPTQKQLDKAQRQAEKEAKEAAEAERRAEELSAAIMQEGIERELAMLAVSYDEKKRVIEAGEASLVETRMKALDAWLEAQRQRVLTPVEAVPKEQDLTEVELTVGPLAGSIEAVEDQIQALREQYRMAADDEARDFIRAQIEGLEKIRDAMEGGRTALMEWQDAFDLIQQGFSMIVDAARQADEARIGAIERRRDAELEAIDAQIDAEARRGQVMTEEEARREVLLQKRRAIEKKHEGEIRRERTRQAEAERTRALFEIAINTAVAVSKVWGQTGIFGLAAQWPVIAMGAAQAALVASQPIPKFARGVDGFGGGVAIVGEEGPELVTLGAGANVITNRNTEMLLSLMSGASRAAPPRSGGVTEASMERAFARALSTSELRASGRSLALVQARDQRLVDKAGLR